MKVVNLHKKKVVGKEKKKGHPKIDSSTQDNQTTRRLSFSFYDEETMKKSKQIIYD